MAVTLGDFKKYPKLYKKANGYAKRDRYYLYRVLGDSMDLNKAFLWGETDEGHYFWGCVEGGAIGNAKELHPELFEQVDIPRKDGRGLRVDKRARDSVDDATPEEWDAVSRAVMAVLNPGKFTFNPRKVLGQEAESLRKKIEYRQEIIMEDTIPRLNELGGEGWMLVDKEGITFIFAREGV